ncbi:hypothetical protein [Nocardia tengchongensis]|uniref:hypothetical protein n=1 Tax=Nocardia tengchongensis TaxID=2055889 RepID=UPI00365E8338
MNDRATEQQIHEWKTAVNSRSDGRDDNALARALFKALCAERDRVAELEGAPADSTSALAREVIGLLDERHRAVQDADARQPDRLVTRLRWRAERTFANAVTAERLARALHGGASAAPDPAILEAARDARAAAAESALALGVTDKRLSELAEAESLATNPPEPDNG